MLKTSTEKEFIEKLKSEGLIPDRDYSSFRQVSGILKWNLPEVEELFRKSGFEFYRGLPPTSQELLQKVPLQILKKERLIPISEEENSVTVATDNPFNYEGLKKLEWFFSKPVKAAVVPFDAVTEFFSSGDLTSEDVQSQESYGEDLLTVEEEAPAVQFINEILTLAVRARASDIHFEPFRDRMRVRLRVDGVLKTVRELPTSKVPPVISRLKIMANLDIAEKRLPQDGRIMVRLGGKEIDIRVSTLPTYFGERVVLRLLSKESILYSTKELGLLPDDYETFSQLIKTPHGIILVTGPTGSGKTGDWPYICKCSKEHSEARPRRDNGRRDKGYRNGRNCNTGSSNWPFSLFNTSHKRCSFICDKACRHGN